MRVADAAQGAWSEAPKALNVPDRTRKRSARWGAAVITGKDA